MPAPIVPLTTIVAPNSTPSTLSSPPADGRLSGIVAMDAEGMGRRSRRRAPLFDQRHQLLKHPMRESPHHVLTVREGELIARLSAHEHAAGAPRALVPYRRQRHP